MWTIETEKEEFDGKTFDVPYAINERGVKIKRAGIGREGIQSFNYISGPLRLKFDVRRRSEDGSPLYAWHVRLGSALEIRLSPERSAALTLSDVRGMAADIRGALSIFPGRVDELPLDKFEFHMSQWSRWSELGGGEP